MITVPPSDVLHRRPDAARDASEDAVPQRDERAAAQQLVHDEAGPRSRTLVVWCPDWPAVAAARQAGKPTSDAGRGLPRQSGAGLQCSSQGRRGSRRTASPGRTITMPGSAHRQGRPRSRWTSLRTGGSGRGIHRPRGGDPSARELSRVPARGPGRYFGSDAAAAERIVDVVESLDVECSVGVADVLAVAVLAAHRGVIVPPGESAEFCAPLPITELARDPAIAPPERAALIDLLHPARDHHSRSVRGAAGAKGGHQVRG